MGQVFHLALVLFVPDLLAISLSNLVQSGTLVPHSNSTYKG